MFERFTNRAQEVIGEAKDVYKRQIMHKAEYDNLTFIENTFGTRAYEHLQAYAKLLDYLLENMKEGEYATGYTLSLIHI